MIQDLRYDLPGDSVLAEAIAQEAGDAGLGVIAHQVASLGLEYGTIVPMHYMNRTAGPRWYRSLRRCSPRRRRAVSSAAATRRAIEQSGERVAILASGRCRTGSGPTEARPGCVDLDRKRIQPPGRFARARTVAAGPLPRIRRHASGLCRQVQR